MKRREFIALIGAAAWPIVAIAQSGHIRRIGVFVSGSTQTHAQYVNAFRSALSDLGYLEGHNYTLSVRWGEGQFDHFRDFAADLIGTTPEVVLATGTAVVAALKHETQIIPIVFVQVADPVASGFVASLSHPGGNLTGLTNYEPAITGKWVELLKEIAPGLSRVALIYNPQATSAGGSNFLGIFEAAATALSVKPITLPFHDLTDIEGMVADLGHQQGGGFVVVPGGSTLVERETLLGFATRFNLPAIYPFRDFTTDGGLISYGANINDQYRRAAVYVDRILKGEKPSDLPVQAPVKYQLAINLRTAKALGLTVSQTLLATADELIE